jgi:uncharacterized protein
METWMETAEDLVHRGRIKVPYTWWVGETGSRFFTTLRDEKRILGTHCSRCAMTFVPPRKACGRCFNTQIAWREVGPRGTLMTYTIPRSAEAIHPLPLPFAFGIVRLDGADTGLAHLIAEYQEGRLKTGIRLEPVFREKGEGNILDIRYFRPASAQ